jgi:hypothetical protein
VVQPVNAAAITQGRLIQVLYNGNIVAQQRYDQLFVDALIEKLKVWHFDPSTGHMSIDFAQYHLVRDRVRYLYSWNGLQTEVPRITNIVANACQEPGGPPPPVNWSIGRLVRINETFERSVLLLLESPHSDEVSEHMVPCSPANGATGRQLHDQRDTIARMLKAYGIVGEEIPVIICNPVPYPTSCRLPLNGYSRHRVWRNKVFRGCIQHPVIERAFRSRLQSYFPTVVINACTGDLGTSPKRFVREQLSAALGTCIAAPDKYAQATRGHSPLVPKAYDQSLIKRWFGNPNANAIAHIELPHPSSWHWLTQWPW